MAYDNSSYWRTVHKEFAAQLRAVGFPGLSEEFNRLKYNSEAETLACALDNVKFLTDKDKIKFLDIGAGTGFWTNLVKEWYSQRDIQVDASALDISEQALDELTERCTWINPIQADLKDIDSTAHENEFDLVTAFYCLHHIVRTKDFLNALSFCSKCVKGGGLLVIMDPILTSAFSNFDTHDFYTYGGNGVPRHLYLLDDLLAQEGFKRVSNKPAVSFLLNGNIQAGTWLTFYISRLIWRALRITYRSGFLTSISKFLIVALDSLLKRVQLTHSSSLVIYKKADYEHKH